ncbi:MULTISPECIES: hypothetical protein [Methylobacterium]|uniref:hypothetical protein n=1 Tax=Methylobacterium TaxID=407 RepID=UPI0019D2D6C4|nr:hypothetical protein [Methylobacterium sp. DB0501]
MSGRFASHPQHAIEGSGWRVGPKVEFEQSGFLQRLDVGQIARLKRLDLLSVGPRSLEPGAPLTYVTTPVFLAWFSVASLRDLPDIEALEEAGLLELDFRTDAPSDPFDTMLGLSGEASGTNSTRSARRACTRSPRSQPPMPLVSRFVPSSATYQRRCAIRACAPRLGGAGSAEEPHRGLVSGFH